MKKATLGIFLLTVLLFMGKTALAQPTISGLSISANSPNNYTNDDLGSSYTTGGGAVETAEAWYRNGNSETVLYLPFEGGATNALLDFSGHSNHASYDVAGTRQPAWTAADGHNLNGVFTFDGDDYLNAGEVLPVDADYTKTAWVYGLGTGLMHRNIMSADYYGDNNHFFKIDPDGRLTAGHSNGSIIAAGRDSLFNDVWYFVAVTFDYESGDLVLYTNGSEVGRGIVPPVLRTVDYPTVLIGSMAFTSEFEGRIDEPKVYDHVLSGEQIESLYDDGNGEIEAAETYSGDEWHVVVTPFSIDAVGSSYTSNTLTIQGFGLTGVSLDASSPDDLTVDDLTASYTPTNASVVETAVAWYKDGIPDAIQYLPFEGGYHNALLDFSGNDNHAAYTVSLNPRPTWIVNGGHNGGGAYYFDALNDYLDAGDVLPQDADYTKTAWIYPTGSGTGFRNIMSSDFYGESNHYFKLDEDGHLAAGQSVGQLTVRDPVPTSTITWYFVAVTFDYETGEIVLYKNGVEVDSDFVPPENRSIADPTVLIGSMAYTVEFLGRIDEPSIYGKVLSADQIQSLYTNGKDELVAAETHGSDEWHVEVTPFSDYEVGNTTTSNSVTLHSTFVSAIPDETITEGSLFSTINLDGSVADYEYADDLIVWTTHGETELTVTVSPARVATIAMPDTDWYGSEDIYFVATNPYGDADSTQVTFTAQNTNDAPVIADIGGQLTPEDITLQPIVTFADVDYTDSHIITVISSDPNVIVDNIGVGTSGSTYDLIPALNWTGSSQITVTVTDDGDTPLSDVEVYTLVVTPVNDVPVLTATVDQTTDEDTDLTGLSVIFSDPDPDGHTITVESNNSNVTMAGLTGHISGSLYNLVPAPNWSGSAVITVTVTDDGDGTLFDFDTYTLTVDGTNDNPVLADIGDQSTNEDVNLAGLVVSFTDPEAGDGHTITVVSSEPNVSMAGLSGHTSGSTYTLVPAANWNGTAQITVRVTDDGTGGLSDFETYTLTVDAVNDAPAITEVGDLNVDEDNVLSGVVVTFTDPETTDTHTIDVVSDEANVTVTNQNGNTSGSSYSLVPSGNWNGTAQITVTVTEEGLDAFFDTETYTLTVNAINDAPDTILLSNDIIVEKVELGSTVGLFTSIDVEIADVHSYSFVLDGGLNDVDNDKFTIVGDTLKTNAEVDFETQSTYSILVQSDDGQGGTASLKFTITVTDVDETSVEDIYNNPLFNVYPVPAIDYVTVEVDNPENKELLLEIYSNAGRLVHAEHIFSKNRIDLTGFSDGMYILRIRGEHIYGTRKLVIKDR